jgi:hypothetical protein
MFHTHKHDGEKVDTKSFTDFVKKSVNENENDFSHPDNSILMPDRKYSNLFYQCEGMPNSEHELLLGISEFEQSVKCFHAKKYDEAE